MRLSERWARLRRPGAPALALLAILQRSPALRVAATLGEHVFKIPAASLIRPGAAALAALGVVDSMAGASTISTNYTFALTTQNPAQASPYTVTGGTAISPVVLQLTATPALTTTPGSWYILGPMPPGLSFGVPGNAVSGLQSGAGAAVNVGVPTFFGTPTTPGTYPMLLEAFQDPNASPAGFYSYYLYYTITVTASPPVFTLAASPASVSVASGRTVVFNAIAAGAPAPTYQWTFKGSTTIPGAAITTDPILMVAGATAASAGAYTCTATNTQGSAASAATLSVVTTSNPGYLNNVSALGYVGTGAGILIGGFNVTGAGGKEILVRGIGPGLNSMFGLGGYLADPYAEVFSGSSPVMAGGSPVQNDNWGTPDYPGAPMQAAVAAAMSTLGAYALPPDSKDAAILFTLPDTGGYTVQVSGVGGGTGTGVVEIYDADSGAPGVRLNNISARDLVQTGQNILIGGFSIAGGTSETVLIRAIGPGLNSTFGLTGVLAQPVLTLFQGSTVIYSNTTWGGDPVLTAAEATVGAYPLVPSSTDSLLLATLAPGGYTAQVSGLNATTGIAVVEVYEVQ